MKTALVYLHVVGKSSTEAPPPEHYAPWSKRFIASYRRYRDATPHDLVVVSCGGPVTDVTRAQFGEAKTHLSYAGGGWDIGAHQFALAALHTRYDYIINMATPVYFHAANLFLMRMVFARRRHGTGIYGPTASYEIQPHIRTCCWATDPKWFVDNYPHVIDTREKTFRAESGDWSITRWCLEQGAPAICVTVDEDLEVSEWRKPKNIFRRGDQSQCLVWDRHTDIYAAASAEEKQQLERRADGNQDS